MSREIWSKLASKRQINPNFNVSFVLKLRATSMLGALAIASTGLLGCESKPTPINSQVKRSSVIYGNDDRRDLFQITDPRTLALADATVALIQARDVRESTDGSSVELAGQSFGEYYRLCPTEPFREQKTSAFCSGFLVGPDLIVTAGHCVRSAINCADTKFVFGYGIKDASQNPNLLPAENVYSCKELIHSEVVNTGPDFAVVRLDREVTGRNPLSLRSQGRVATGDQMLVIGHPSGLPTKVGTGSVRRDQGAYFVTNLDTYGGNSGSAVFNQRTGEVEGILVRGEDDFVFEGSCRKSKVCTEDGCRGEDVTSIEQVRPFLERSNEDTPDTWTIRPGTAIPDNLRSGAEIRIPVNQDLGSRRILVGLKIRHSFIGDLEITLTAPNGNTVRLHSRSGGSAHNIDGIYGQTLTPAESLANFAGAPQGIWVLHVSDLSSGDIGIIERVSIRFLQ